MISSEMITIVVGMVGTIGVGGMAWQKRISAEEELKNMITGLAKSVDDKIDRHIADNARNDDQIDQKFKWLISWREDHEKDVSEKRFDMQKQFGILEGRVTMHDGNYTQILQILSEIKQELKELRQKYK